MPKFILQAQFEGDFFRVKYNQILLILPLSVIPRGPQSAPSSMEIL